MLRIPKRVNFPFGYQVRVDQCPSTEMDMIAPDADGLWDCASRTILIRKSLPPKRKAYILAHELGHAWLDWTHLFLDNGEVKP